MSLTLLTLAACTSTPEDSRYPDTDTGPDMELADLVIDALSIVPGNPTVNDALNGEGTVINNGVLPSEDSTVVLELLNSDGQGSTKTFGMPALQPGESFDFGLQYVTQPAGSYELVATVDPDNTTAEHSEDNNVMIVPFHVEGPPTPANLTPTTFYYSPENPSTADTITIGGIVENTGGETAPASTMVVEEERSGYGVPYRTITVDIPAIEAGGSHVWGESLGTYEAGRYRWIVFTDYWDEIDESNESDNKWDPVTDGDNMVCEVTE